MTARGWEPKAIKTELGRHYARRDSYWSGLPTDTQAVFSQMLDGIGDDEIRIDLHPDTDRDATRAAFVLAGPSGDLLAHGGGPQCWSAPISSMRAPIPPRTALRPRCSCGAAAEPVSSPVEPPSLLRSNAPSIGNHYPSPATTISVSIGLNGPYWRSANAAAKLQMICSNSDGDQRKRS